MSKQSSFDKIMEIFKIARPSIERGIDSMQPYDRQKAKQAWQELILLLEARETDIEELAGKLKVFSQQVREYRIRAGILASSTEMDIV